MTTYTCVVARSTNGCAVLWMCGLLGQYGGGSLSSIVLFIVFIFNIGALIREEMLF